MPQLLKGKMTCILEAKMIYFTMMLSKFAFRRSEDIFPLAIISNHQLKMLSLRTQRWSKNVNACSTVACYGWRPASWLGGLMSLLNHWALIHYSSGEWQWTLPRAACGKCWIWTQHKKTSRNGNISVAFGYMAPITENRCPIYTQWRIGSKMISRMLYRKGMGFRVRQT